jgi:hypothetical protein
MDMDLFLQCWGGAFYLGNKIFFSVAERKNEPKRRQLRISGWIVYLLGVPAWVIILILKSNWIAASIEAGAVPSLLFGLYNVVRNSREPNRLFDRIASFFTYFFIALGTGYSIYEYRGITSVSQYLEIGTMVGFLMGSYLLAKNRIAGWPFFILMNISMGTLMLIQAKPILAVQQGISLCFVVYGFVTASKRNTTDKGEYRGSKSNDLE